MERHQQAGGPLDPEETDQALLWSWGGTLERGSLTFSLCNLLHDSSNIYNLFHFVPTHVLRRALYVSLSFFFPPSIDLKAALELRVSPGTFMLRRRLSEPPDVERVSLTCGTSFLEVILPRPNEDMLEVVVFVGKLGRAAGDGDCAS